VEKLPESWEQAEYLGRGSQVCSVSSWNVNVRREDGERGETQETEINRVYGGHTLKREGHSSKYADANLAGLADFARSLMGGCLVGSHCT